MTQHRIALVTGGNKGIGLQIARQLAEAGLHVVIGSRDATLGAAAVSELARDGLTATTVALDLDAPETHAATAAQLEADHGRLDVLVNNAGIFDFGDAMPSQASLDAVRRVMEVNFIGTLAVTQAMLPLLKAAPRGRIVNVSTSLASLTLNGDPTSTYYSQQFIGYNASKAALNMLTVQLHEELKDTGIKVNSVSPGFVKTDLTGFGDMTPRRGRAAAGAIRAGRRRERPVRGTRRSDALVRARADGAPGGHCRPRPGNPGSQRREPFGRAWRTPTSARGLRRPSRPAPAAVTGMVLPCRARSRSRYRCRPEDQVARLGHVDPSGVGQPRLPFLRPGGASYPAVGTPGQQHVHRETVDLAREVGVALRVRAQSFRTPLTSCQTAASK
ncbi:SDR family NAD(P)-dependent oxidoreductase [Allosediminivita pacifica]|uniref:NAD(P)-dependent dehydrogenase (Short-subunit alcohol dehydrogenase family) n=1 Tax=Allosediminivita pacifica TaxID=1267769 RepID=A0A2T6AQ37_9RHOB|nr:SDR family NAD(P)-dependent oxidoreductase [Allosediminivita pacifica]PTX45846.1 NAD(P)-dependent dehydrogenase (short-subunit alcohol dehydrogenase family) [Allosediminivita pacifica]GGB19735.1 hypothetical protein GCM10011324_32290 [Allosediminivita pacifica]